MKLMFPQNLLSLLQHIDLGQALPIGLWAVLKVWGSTPGSDCFDRNPATVGQQTLPVAFIAPVRFRQTCIFLAKRFWLQRLTVPLLSPCTLAFPSQVNTPEPIRFTADRRQIF